MKLLNLGWLLATLLHLTGCSSTTWDSIRDTWEKSNGSVQHNRVNEAYIKQLPYASLLVSVTPSPSILMVLGEVEDNKLFWYSENHSIIVTEGARITALEDGVNNVRIYPIDSDPVSTQHWQDHQTYQIRIDLPSKGWFGQVLSCRLEDTDIQEQIDTPLGTKETQQFIEICRDVESRLSFKNRYWVDQSDFRRVIKSEQKVHPNVNSIILVEAKRFVK